MSAVGMDLLPSIKDEHLLKYYRHEKVIKFKAGGSLQGFDYGWHRAITSSRLKEHIWLVKYM